MSTPFQNRIVGTVIVAAVAIIFLPDFLDGDKKKYNAEFENIPTAPKVDIDTSIKTFPIDKLKNIELKTERVIDVEQDNVLQLSSTNDTESNDTKSESIGTSLSSSSDTVKVNTFKKPEDFNNTPSKKAQSTAKKNASSVPKKINAKESWVIQLGSFRHQKNVLDLITKLKDHGYTTFTRPIKTKNGTLTKVFIGPNINKSSLESKVEPLKALTNVQGKVTRFYPTK